MDRQQFYKSQVDKADDDFSLTANEPDARKQFMDLAMDTFDFLVASGADFSDSFTPRPTSAWNPLNGGHWGKLGVGNPAIRLPPGLMERWKDWSQEYFKIRARNPRLELRDMMEDIGETHVFASWPYPLEGRIWRWVDAGDPSTPPPFDDRQGIVTPALFKRLKQLGQLCDGWLYWNNDLNRIVFAPELEGRRICEKEEAEEAKRNQEREKSRALAESRETRRREIVAIARSDTEFWEALRTWELQREAKRPVGWAPTDPPTKDSIFSMYADRQNLAAELWEN